MLPEIAVIVPTKFASNPRTGRPWLLESLRCLKAQTLQPRQIIVCIDSHAVRPPVGQSRDGVEIVYAISRADGDQAQAVNAGVEAAHHDLIAICEDDDMACPKRLELSLQAMQRFDAEFVSSNSLAVDHSCNALGVRNNCDPSGWFFKQSLWNEIGGFNHTDFHWHFDNDFLGKINKRRTKRVHLVHKTVENDDPWLGHVALHSKVVNTREELPLFAKTMHAGSRMGEIKAQDKAGTESSEEYKRLIALYGPKAHW
jgi:glycosyltransferase involved in cell wall biosynthesis